MRHHDTKDPFVLQSNVIFFHDWRYVHHGAPRWEPRDGWRAGIWGSDAVSSLRWASHDNPTGIGLRVMPPHKSEPFFRCDAPWEGMIMCPTVMRERGRYRLWYEAIPTEDMDSGKAGRRNCLVVSSLSEIRFT